MRKLAASLLVAVLVATFAIAQSNQGTLEGTVQDPSGAVVAGATLTMTNTATGAAFTTESSPEGIYRFAVLPVGNYDLKVQKAGFADSTRQGVQISVGTKVNYDVKLNVTGAAETINVSAEAPVLETTRTQLSTNVDATAVRDLPVNGRNFLDFVLLTPGVTRDVRTGDLSFAGQRGTLNSLTVDGVDDNNTFFGQTTGRTGSGRAPYQFSQDAVQEFQVNTNGYSAELGRAGGAVINVVTKSGTNNFHGTGFWFFRDRALAAQDPIRKFTNAANNDRGCTPAQNSAGVQNCKPAYHFNQFGGDIGGPIVKNKAFFFFDYDGQRNTQPNLVTLVIPTIAAPTSFQTAAINYLNARSASWTRGLNQDTYLTKGDFNINANNIASVRWNRQNFTGVNFENGSNTQALEHSGNSLVNSDSVAAQLTSTLTNSLVNVGRFQWQRDNEPGLANSNLPEATILQGGQTVLTVGRNSFSPRETTIHRQQYADTVTWTRGRHTAKFGADFIHDDIFNFFPGNFSGVYSFSSLENFGRSLAGQPLLNPTSNDRFDQNFAGPGTDGPVTHPNIFEMSYFAQDDWKVRNNLTLNLGIRYDVQSTARPKVQNPAAAAVGIFTDRLETDKNNIAPRIGFAWQPLASGKMVVRGGYGIFYGRTPSIFIGTAHSNNGVSVVSKRFTPGAGMPSYPNTICGAPVDTPSCAAPTTGAFLPTNIFVMQPNFVEPVIQQSNLNVEYQFGQNTTLTVGTLYVKGQHLQRTRDINLGNATTQTIATTTGQTFTFTRFGARPITALAKVLQFESSANSVYNGMVVELKRRMARNFQFLASYTWSHAIDDAPDATAVVIGADDSKQLYNPLCPQCDRASSVNDQRHRLVVSGVWQLTYANGMSRVPKAILGGWELSAILTGQTGQPYTGFVSSDLNNDGNSATERIGESRNQFNLPNVWLLDPRFSKSINFTERARMQLFVEAFNLFNHFNQYSVRTTQYAVNAGGQLVPQVVPTTSFVTAFQAPQNAPGGSVPSINLNGARVFQVGAKVLF